MNGVHPTETHATADGLWPTVRLQRELQNPDFPSQILARVAEGETLKEIAKSIGLPKTQFLMWVAANGDLSAACLRIRELAGVELRFEGLDIVDAATPEDVSVAKLQADYRKDLSRDLNKPLFGKMVQHKHELGKDWGDRLRRARERVIEGEVVDTDQRVPAESEGTQALDISSMSSATASQEMQPVDDGIV